MSTTQLITTLTFSTLIIASASLASEDLGPAEGFTIFTFQSFQANHTNCTGRVAVGGPATYNTVGIGSALLNSNGQRDDLIVAGNLTWIGGDNFNGNIQVAGPVNLNNVDVPNGTVGENVEIDFCAAENELQDISDTIAAIPSNGEAVREDNQLLLTGTHETLNVFTITSDCLHQIVELIVHVPEESSVLVNMNLNTVKLKNFEIVLVGCDATHVLFNIPDTTQIQLKNIAWKGTILAPKANVHFNNAQIDGALICRSIQGNGESRHAPFVGYCVCCCHDDDDCNECDCDCNITIASGVFD
jgi:choice-of-anchor A domain-containing protein